MGKRKDENGSYWQNMRAYEKGLLEWAFEATGDSPTRTAEMLGINASYLYERCKIVGIHRPGKGKKIDEVTGEVVDATPKLKLVPAARAVAAEPEPEVDDVEDEEGDDAAAEDFAEETDSDAIGDSTGTEDSVDAEDEEADAEEDEDEDGVDEDDYIEEEVPDDECYCGAKLTTEEERTKWAECLACRTNRKTNAAGAVPAVMLDDDEEVG